MSVINIVTAHRVRPKFQLGDVVKVIGKYAGDWERCHILIVGVRRKVLDGDLTDKITYDTWLHGEGITDGWTEDDLELVDRQP